MNDKNDRAGDVSPIPVHLLEAIKKKNERKPGFESVTRANSPVKAQGSISALRRELDEMAKVFASAPRPAVAPTAVSPKAIEPKAFETTTVEATSFEPQVTPAPFEEKAEATPAPVASPPVVEAASDEIPASVVIAESTKEVAVEAPVVESPAVAVPGAWYHQPEPAVEIPTPVEEPVAEESPAEEPMAEEAERPFDWYRNREGTSASREEAPVENELKAEEDSVLESVEAGDEEIVVAMSAQEDDVVVVEEPSEEEGGADAAMAVYAEENRDEIDYHHEPLYSYETVESPVQSYNVAASCHQEPEEVAESTEDEGGEGPSLVVPVESLGAGIIHSIENGVGGVVETGKASAQAVGSMVSGGSRKVKTFFRADEAVEAVKASDVEKLAGLVGEAGRQSRSVTDVVADGMFACAKGVGVLAGYVVAGAVAAPVDLARGTMGIASDLAAGAVRLVTGRKDRSNDER